MNSRSSRMLLSLVRGLKTVGPCSGVSSTESYHNSISFLMRDGPLGPCLEEYFDSSMYLMLCCSIELEGSAYLKKLPHFARVLMVRNIYLIMMTMSIGLLLIVVDDWVVVDDDDDDGCVGEDILNVYVARRGNKTRRWTVPENLNFSK